MKALRSVAFLLVGYVAFVAAFESMIGILQPEAGLVLTITTTDSAGQTSDRVLAHLVTDGRTYVAANHWPRAWYRQALENPTVQATIEGETDDYVAVPVDEAEFERVDSEHARGIGFMIMTGFPPREILRLDPKSTTSFRNRARRSSPSRDAIRLDEWIDPIAASTGIDA